MATEKYFAEWVVCSFILTYDKGNIDMNMFLANTNMEESWQLHKLNVKICLGKDLDDLLAN